MKLFESYEIRVYTLELQNYYFYVMSFSIDNIINLSESQWSNRFYVYTRNIALKAAHFLTLYFLLRVKRIAITLKMAQTYHTNKKIRYVLLLNADKKLHDKEKKNIYRQVG